MVSCQLQTVTVLILPFQFELLLFLFLVWCLWLEFLILYWIVESGHPCLVPDLRGNAFSFSPLNMMFTIGFSYMVFIVLSHVPALPTLLSVFIINRCWILSKAFSVSIGMIIWILFFIFLMWCILLIDLYVLNHPCILGINSTCSWSIIPFI